MSEDRTKTEALADCPFCGGNAAYYPSQEVVFTASWIGHVVHCTNCQARVQTSASIEAACLMWNRRATRPAPEPVEPREALEVTEDMVEAGAQALVNDVWRPNPSLKSLNKAAANGYRRQALLVLKAALFPVSQNNGKGGV